MTLVQKRARTPLALIAGIALAGAPLAAVAAAAQDPAATEPTLVSAVDGAFEIDGNIAADGTGVYDWENYPAELQSFLYDNGSREAACSETGADVTILEGGAKADDYPFAEQIISGQTHDKDDLCAVRQAIQTVVHTGDDGEASYQHLYHVMVSVATGEGESNILQFFPAGDEGPEGDLALRFDYDSSGKLIHGEIWILTDGAWTYDAPLAEPYLVDFATGVRPEIDGDDFKNNAKHYQHTAVEYTLDLSALNAAYDLYGENDECIAYGPGDIATFTGQGAFDKLTPQMKDILDNDWVIDTCVEETPTPTPTDSETPIPTTTGETETPTPTETPEPTETAPVTPIPTTTTPAGTAPAGTQPGTTPPLASTGSNFDYGVLAGALALIGGGALLALRRLGRDAA